MLELVLEFQILLVQSCHLGGKLSEDGSFTRFCLPPIDFSSKRINVTLLGVEDVENMFDWYRKETKSGAVTYCTLSAGQKLSVRCSRDFRRAGFLGLAYMCPARV